MNASFPCAGLFIQGLSPLRPGGIRKGGRVPGVSAAKEHGSGWPYLRTTQVEGEVWLGSSFLWLPSSSPGNQRVRFGENTSYFSKFTSRGSGNGTSSGKDSGHLVGAKCHSLEIGEKQASNLLRGIFKVDWLCLANVEKAKGCRSLSCSLSPGWS